MQTRIQNNMLFFICSIHFCLHFFLNSYNVKSLITSDKFTIKCKLISSRSSDVILWFPGWYTSLLSFPIHNHTNIATRVPSPFSVSEVWGAPGPYCERCTYGACRRRGMDGLFRGLFDPSVSHRDTGAPAGNQHLNTLNTTEPWYAYTPPQSGGLDLPTWRSRSLI